MMTNKLCVFGEVLFDVFPDGKHVLGGAPFNVAWHLQSFGMAPCFISRVGDDEAGRSIQQLMQQRQMDTSALQLDTALPTGVVDVKLNNGEPSYDIVCPSAYDHIETPDLAAPIDFLYHGSLALRQASSEAALQTVLDKQPKLVFLDVNLRDPWWQKEKVLSWVKQANWVKLNTEELALLFPSDQPAKALHAQFIETFDLDGMILTHGSKGAEVVTAKQETVHVTPEGNVTVVDTVGAGDAFASVMILGLIKQWPMAETLKRAQAFASTVVQTRGATIQDQQIYSDLLSRW